MSDPVVEAMRAGAGLPVLAPLDRHLETRAREDRQAGDATDVVADVLDAIDDWLNRLDERTRARLDACDEGPLVVRMRRHVDETVEPARRRVDAMAPSSDQEPRWDALVALLGDLHEVREDLQAVQRVCGHLEELSRLVGDVPDDPAGRRALDELSAREAETAARDDPAAWLDAARELERRALEAIRLGDPQRRDVEPLVTVQDGTPAPETTPAPDGDGAGSKPPIDDAALAAADALPRVEVDAGSNGYAAGPAPKTGGTDPSRSADPAALAETETETDAEAETVERSPPGARDEDGAAGRNGHEPHTTGIEDPSAGHRNGAPRPPKSSSRTGHERAAGPEVLSEWETSRDDGSLRHAPLWAPIRQGDIAPGEGTADELLDHAREVEIDLVDLELPRVLAIRTNSDPTKVRAGIAERAEEITRREPTRPAREAFLDYVTGKLPRRYRETSLGLALVESIAHALCTDDPWTTAGPDYDDTVREMVQAELERTPALDVAELAGSLVGASADARETVKQAAAELAETDPDVTFHEDGVLVRPTAAREDPDSLYDLRESLTRRLPEARAQELVETLITTPEEEDPR